MKIVNGQVTGMAIRGKPKSDGLVQCKHCKGVGWAWENDHRLVGGDILPYKKWDECGWCRGIGLDDKWECSNCNGYGSESEEYETFKCTSCGGCGHRDGAPDDWVHITKRGLKKPNPNQGDAAKRALIAAWRDEDCVKDFFHLWRTSQEVGPDMAKRVKNYLKVVGASLRMATRKEQR